MTTQDGTAGLWVIRAAGQDYGPYTVDQIISYIGEGRVTAQTQIAAAGSAIWAAAATLPVFAGFFAPPPAPGAPVRTAAAPPVAGAKRADFLVRAGAILIDGAILLVAQLVLGGIVGAILGDLIATLATLAMGVAYFVVLHASDQQATIGKRVLGIKLVRDDGARVTQKDALLRYLAAMLSGLILGVGYLLALRPDRKTLHDMLCHTHVVTTKG